MSYYDTTTGVARHSHYEVETLESSVSDLEGSVSKLRRSLEELRGEYDTTSEAVSEVESAVDRVRSSVGDLEGQFEALEERAEWLESVIVRAGLAKPVKLDDWTAAERKLGQARALGLSAEASLLSDYSRSTKTSVINQVRHARRLAAETRVEVAAAAKRVTSIGAHDRPEIEAAATAYQEAKRKLEKAERIVETQKDTAAGYEAELAEDDRMRAELADTIAAGRRATMTLLDRYKTVIGEGVAAAGMFPRWLVAALGPSAPAEDAAGWIATAAELAVYRITFGIVSTDRALGEMPDYRAPGYQSSEYRDLWAKVRRH